MILRIIFGFNRRNLLTIAGICLILVGTHVVSSSQLIRYAGYLAIFSIWMVWFVDTAVDLIDYSSG